MFAGQHGFVTARDLLRWANRRPATYQELADDGFMLLGERLRRDDERAIVRDVVQKHCKAKVDTTYAWDANMRKRDKPDEEEGSERRAGVKRSRTSNGAKHTRHAAADTTEHPKFSTAYLMAHLNRLVRAGAVHVGGGSGAAASAGPASNGGAAGAGNGAAPAHTGDSDALEAADATGAGVTGVAWTSGLQRLLVLVGRCIASKEPVLLVGPTGSGKTSFCQCVRACWMSPAAFLGAPAHVCLVVVVNQVPVAVVEHAAAHCELPRAHGNR